MSNKNLSQFGMMMSFVWTLFGCSSLPINVGLAQADYSSSIDYSDTLLARTFLPVTQDGSSGNLLLRDGHQALVERLYLTDVAEKSIDAQYFLWNDDKSGKLLLQRLIKAADRGVYVRVLIDGFSIAEHHMQLAYLAAHENVDIRVYNPMIGRSAMDRIFNFATEFDRLNQRMHNKSFIVDGSVAITGGRNIGDAYFFYDENYNFYDMDVFSVGPVVSTISNSFDFYWSSPWAIPITDIYKVKNAVESREFTNALLEENLSHFLKSNEAADVASAEFLENYYQQQSESLVWAPTTYIYDTPGGLAELAEDEPKEVALEIADLVMNSRKQVLVESAYLVLSDKSIDIFRQRQQEGVEVKFLTNSMASNNLLMNHAGYVKVREDILKTGAEIYELKPSIESCNESESLAFECEHHLVGLHAKAAVFDLSSVYIGSLNFNFRSAFINTEAALVIQSPEIAAELADIIVQNMNLSHSWQATLEKGDVAWLTEQEQVVALLKQEPSTTWLERIGVDLLTWIPGTVYY